MKLIPNNQKEYWKLRIMWVYIGIFLQIATLLLVIYSLTK